MSINIKIPERYGDEWSREVLRNSKTAIVSMLRNVAQERDELRVENDRLGSLQTEIADALEKRLELVAKIGELERKLAAADELAEGIGEAVAKVHSRAYTSADGFFHDVEKFYLHFEGAGGEG